MGDSVASPLLAAIETHYEELIAFVRRTVGCPELAADIVQETYLRLAGKAELAAVANPRAFLYRVARNLAIDRLRHERARARYFTGMPVPESAAAPEPSVEAAIEARERLVLLAAAIDELPARCRQVFIMRKFEDMDQGAIAAALGISRNMVEKHLRKALLPCAARLRSSA